MRPLLLTITLAGLLLTGLMVLLGNQLLFHDPLPTLQRVVEQPNEISTTRMAITKDGYAYVLNETTDSIAVLRGTEVVTTMRFAPSHVGGRVLFEDIAAHPTTGLVYVTDALRDGVYVISKTAIITTINLSEPGITVSPDKIAIHPKTGYVYVSDAVSLPNTNGAQEMVGVVRVISGTQLISSVATASKWIRVLTVDPRTERVYVGQTLYSNHPNTSLVAVIDGTQLVMTATFGYNAAADGFDYQVEDLAINDQTGDVYILATGGLLRWDGNDQVERLSLSDGGELAPAISLGIDPTRDLVYVGILQSPFALVLGRQQPVKQLHIVAGSGKIIYDKTHDYIYTADYNGPSMSVIRGTKVLATLATGGYGPSDVAVDEQRGYIYVSNADSHNIAVFALETPTWQQRFLPLVEP